MADFTTFGNTASAHLRFHDKVMDKIIDITFNSNSTISFDVL